MARIKGSDNEFPKLLLVEGAAPGTPATGLHALYVKSSDGKLYRKDDAGAEVEVGAAGSVAAEDVTLADVGGNTAETDAEGAIAELYDLVGAVTGAAFCGVRASRTATQTLSTATHTDVQFTAADEFDSDAFHDPGSSPEQVVVPTGKAGYYIASAWASFVNSTSGTFRLVRLLVNGTPVSEVSVPFHSNVGVNGNLSAILHLDAGDVVELSVYQDTGGNLNLATARLALARIAEG